ncbi:MotA/TolQ/ExbB proton channel family protein [Myxococcus sp. MISCRS1]|uniref:MotA/TolQ/ExbB proton channel family protein n=1 Tax=Myxococcus TaxID=32 RepID=UPI0011428FED|nr:MULTISPECIES: MotA/TolQ/ExbB proton channel family protein [Myxococcus]BDT31949.1 MotA/TolQ/ExbB proton channel family protein [Myxococcus sp. MH1]MBZ4401998.1 MotA/TolQ/ExbB proton channel family protein [Myxococcus sp. AS-1-15]MBZ4408087.1 MotA/TolQ/ExbB proton channel family protein [Myxococcus sp. XM-1-1-1]MCK8502515.1 MotA/TolQ/ExbB proton channel family protein [Myxococcus fulvus]MCY0997990.1 MotA/TolQ/ExbB proton channel family protein [Myxococcus sp. MISCRS1]
MQFTLVEIWAHTGLFARMIIFTLAIMSVASLVVMAERMIVFRKTRSDSRNFAAKMGAILAKGDLTTAANTNLGKDVGHLGRVINSGLTAYRISPNNKDVAVESVARALERQAQREVQSMKRGLGLLATVGSTAPFVGLLGTTMGIVNAFQLMAAAGSGGLGTISAGIAEALITTAFGLLVAIPAVMAYNFLQGWVDARAVDISESSNEFLDVVARHLGGGAQSSHAA